MADRLKNAANKLGQHHHRQHVEDGYDWGGSSNAEGRGQTKDKKDEVMATVIASGVETSMCMCSQVMKDLIFNIRSIGGSSLWGINAGASQDMEDQHKKADGSTIGSSNSSAMTE